MRARVPDVEAVVDRDGIAIFYEVYEHARPTVLLLPSAPTTHSRQWKAQIPYLSRHFRVVTYDGRGNGRSDRPVAAAAYRDGEFLRDTIAVMDAARTESAVVVSLCHAWQAIQLAAAHPGRVDALVLLAPDLPGLAVHHVARRNATARFHERRPATERWDMYNRYVWREDYARWVAFFCAELLPEPHSTKQWEDAVQWMLDGSGEIMAAWEEVDDPMYPNSVEACVDLLGAVRCPVLVIHGDIDRCQPLSTSETVARVTGATIVRLHGSGHLAMARDPVRVNMLIKDFVDELAT